ncbi:MAG: hypothetical protein DWQ10_08600 [Calditrichaeota bacterium]|nr:MAG: hypothetical protein DWQ10_08600 [Calditrichota bacterium]
MRRVVLSGIFFIAFVGMQFHTNASAQERPFLFTFSTPEAESKPMVLHYDAAYGRRAFEPLGIDNTEQALGVYAGFGKAYTVIGKLGFAFNNSTIRSSQHVEVLRQFTKSKDNLVDFSFGPGFRHEYSGTDVLLARALVGRRFTKWQIYSNCVLEKPLSDKRDEVDLFFTFGSLRRVSSAIQLGFEAVGQDLEGFWDEEEAEGGARLFIGPTVVVDFPANPWALTLGAGPIIRATRSVQTSLAPRALETTENGFIIHAALNFSL